MRKAMIAALLVIASTLAFSLWSKLECSCQASQVEIATAIAGPMLRCVQEQLLHRDSALLTLQGVVAQPENAEGSPFAWTSIVVNVFLDPAVANFGSSQRVNSFVVVSISW